jgi:hypothetical protein
MIEYIKPQPKEAGDAVLTQMALARISFLTTLHRQPILNRSNDARTTTYGEAVGLQILQDMADDGSYNDITEFMALQVDEVAIVNQSCFRTGIRIALNKHLNTVEQEEGVEV